MEHILVKVYASLHPADALCAEAVLQAGAAAVRDGGEPWLFHDFDGLRISFEGLHFPEEEVLAALEAHLSAQTSGKMDVLDLEGWELRRYTREHGAFRLSRRGLNHVLDYSGH